jgi:hypothetical protein
MIITNKYIMQKTNEYMLKRCFSPQLKFLLMVQILVYEYKYRGCKKKKKKREREGKHISVRETLSLMLDNAHDLGEK